MIQVRRSSDRGQADHGWLRTFHSFSFADYYDQRFESFRALRVINEDFVAAGKGFGTHAHRDMEIITYVLSGELKHQDSMGTGSIIRPGDVQKMSAGTGVTHSEVNSSSREELHLLQIWILPERAGITPAYQEKRFEREAKLNQLRLIASRDGREGTILVHQDVNLFAAVIDSPEVELSHSMPAERHAWLQVARGSVIVNGVALGQGDAAAIKSENSLKISGEAESEFLLFDLA